MGTDNPRQLRAIDALLRRPTTREQLDDVTGSSNSPDVIAKLRDRGLDIPCERIEFIDRDRKVCHPGVYAFTSTDRRKVYRWIAKRKQGAERRTGELLKDLARAAPEQRNTAGLNQHVEVSPNDAEKPAFIATPSPYASALRLT